MSTIERIKEMVIFWDGELRKATTQERIGLCERRLQQANTINLASMNQKQAAAPVGN